jgi:hypothetical protein
VSVRHSLIRILGKDFVKVVQAVLVENFKELDAVLEAAVHTLAVEGYHGMGRIAQKNTLFAVMRSALDLISLNQLRLFEITNLVFDLVTLTVKSG